jgi:hypothetical protein
MRLANGFVTCRSRRKSSSQLRAVKRGLQGSGRADLGAATELFAKRFGVAADIRQTVSDDVHETKVDAALCERLAKQDVTHGFGAKGTAAVDGQQTMLEAREIKNVDEIALARIAEIMRAGAERAEVTVEQVVRELKLIGFFDIRKVVSWRNELVTRTEKGKDGEPVMVLMPRVTIVDADKISDEAAAAVADGDGCAQPVAAARLGPAAASAVANQMARLER